MKAFGPVTASKNQEDAGQEPIAATRNSDPTRAVITHSGGHMHPLNLALWATGQRRLRQTNGVYHMRRRVLVWIAP